MPKGGRSGSRSSSFGKSKSHGTSFGHRHKTSIGSLSFGIGASRSRTKPRSNGHSLGARRRYGSAHMVRSGVAVNICAGKVYTLPTPPGPFYSPGRLCYRGTVENLQAQFSAISMQDQSTIREVTLCLTGTIAQQEGKCCKAMTCLAGMLCIFPFFLNCCDCYKRQVEKLYSINEQEYRMIGGILQQCRQVQHVKIFLQDNYLTQEKTNILQGYLNALPLAAFTFSNCVEGINLQRGEYDNFDNLFNGLKQSKWILVSLLWDDNFYLTKDYQPKQGIPMPNIPGFPMPNMNMQGMQMPGMPGMPGMQPGMPPMPPMPVGMDSLNEPLGSYQANPFLNAYLNSDPFSIAMNQQVPNMGMPVGTDPNNMTNMGLNGMMAGMTNQFDNKML